MFHQMISKVSCAIFASISHFVPTMDTLDQFFQLIIPQVFPDETFILAIFGHVFKGFKIT